MEIVKLQKSGNFMWVTDLRTNTVTRFPAKDTYYTFEDKNRVLVLTWDKNNGETYHRYKVSELVDSNEEPWASFAALDTFLAENLGFNGGGGTSGTTPSYPQTLAVGDKVFDAISGDRTWQVADRLKYWQVQAGIQTLDDSLDIFPEYSLIEGVIQNDDINATVTFDFSLTSPFYLNQNITTLTLNVGDSFQLKKGGGTWILTVTNKSSGGGGDYLPLAGGTMDAGADINFANGSKISEGSTDEQTGGNKGIALTCSIGYEWKWEAGEAYLRDQSGNIRVKQYAMTIPLPTDDSTKGFTSASCWVTLGGQIYQCQDATIGAAVWEQQYVEVNLTQVLTSGDIGSSTYNLDTRDYTFQVEDRLKINFFNNQIEESNSVFLDKTIIFPDNSTIIFQNQINSIPIENIQLFDFLFTTDATVYYKGFKVTSLPIQPGDYCVLKLVGFETDFNTQVWSLSILSKPTNPKVFIALLKQSGTSDSITLSSGDSVIKGITYKIDGGSDGDFSNIGAPSNDDSTSFIATKNGAPTSYGSAVLLYDPGAPVAKVLKNTLGNVWFEYDSEGNYFCKSNCVFTENKTTIDIDPYGNNGDPACNIVYKDVEPCIFKIGTFKNQYSNGYLFNTRLEIEVYN